MEGSTKLLINLKEGIVEVEGAEEFVRDVYNDFKERVSKPIPFAPAPPAQIEQLSDGQEAGSEPASRTRAKHRRPVATTGKSGESVNYKPKFNNEINLSGLAEFYENYKPSTHNEKIVVFAAFLRDSLGKSLCTSDDIFTCYFTMRGKTKTPEAFLQAFRTCQARTHYIKYVSPTHIEVTIPGDNFLNSKIKQ
jgi:hypothetical protein